AIADNYTSLEQVQDDLRRRGLESSNLIVAVDWTKSNEWTGKHSFGGRSLHSVGDVPSPYEEVIGVVGRTLSAFDDDGLIPCYGFGDVTTGDQSVFSFQADDQPCRGLEQVLWRYRELCPHIPMAGPTSFAPAIRNACRIVEASGRRYHILLLVADG
ncbi:E3 ubiquitin-protein ligase, partial [Tetrabaena socialis]